MFFNIPQKPSRYIQDFLFSKKLLKEDSYIPIGIIFAIALYVPFEDIITVWLPLPSAGQSLFRAIPELTIYFLFARIIYLRITLGLGFRRTAIDSLVAAFFLSCTISVLINQASFRSSYNYLRESWRYLTVYYVLVNIEIPHGKVKTLVEHIKNIGILQGILASIQFFLPGHLKVTMAGGGCEKALLKGASCGSFIDSATLAGFLLIAIAILITYVINHPEKYLKQPKNIIIVLLALFGLFASKKRASLLILSVLPITIIGLSRKKKTLRKYIWLLMSLAIGLLFIVPFLIANFGLVTQESSAVAQTDISSYFLRIFSPEYWDDFLLNARGWFIALTVKSLSESGSWFFGFSPDHGTTISTINSLIVSASDAAKLARDQYVFQDAFWFAQLAYYGIIGLSLYWSILLSLYRSSCRLLKTTQWPEFQSLGIIFCAVIMIGFLYSFSERLFVLRTYSYYFWLFAGLIANAEYTQKKLRELLNKMDHIN